MTTNADVPPPPDPPNPTPELDTLPELPPDDPEAIEAAPLKLDGRLGGVMPPEFAQLKRAITFLSLGSLVALTAPFFMCVASVFSLNTQLMGLVWLSWAVLLPATAISGGFALARAIKMKREYGVFPEVAWLAVFTLLGVPGAGFYLVMAATEAF